MNIPQLTDIDIAIKIYYLFPEIGSKEIAQLFRKHSKSTINRLKKLAQKYMVAESVYTHGMYKINTECAYKAWGIDIEDLEKRRDKLQKLRVIKITFGVAVNYVLC